MNNSILLKETSQTLLKMAEILKTIAHPVRFDIIKILSKDDNHTVTELQTLLNCDCEQSMLSHHLTKMKDKGILHSTKNGKFIYYSLVDKNITSLFTCLDKCKIH